MDVVIVGGGPNGLMLACELALGGVRHSRLERLAAPSTEPRSNGLVGQVVRMVDRRGLFERLSGQPGPPHPNNGYFMFAAMPLNLSLLDRQSRLQPAGAGAENRAGTGRTRHRAGRGDPPRPQAHRPDPGRRRCHPHRPTARTGAYELRTSYVVGADSAHSPVRKAAGIGFPGVTYDGPTSRAAHVTVPTDWLDPTTGALNVPGHGPVLPFLPDPHRPAAASPTHHSPAARRWSPPAEWDEPAARTNPMTPRRDAGQHQPGARRRHPARPASRRRPARAAQDERRQHPSRRAVPRRPGVPRRRRRARLRRRRHRAQPRHAGRDQPGLEARRRAERAAPTSWTPTRPNAARSPTGPSRSPRHRHALRPRRGRHRPTRTCSASCSPNRDAVQVIADLVAGADVRYPVDDDAHPLAGWPAPDLDLHTKDGTVRLAELVQKGHARY